MGAFDNFDLKRRKYMPTFPRASGMPTVYIEGYPSEDEAPISATGFHGEQITSLSTQFKMYFGTDNRVYVGIDSFIFYREGDITKFVAPDIYIVFGVDPFPERRSFYTWAEGIAPAVIFEFLSDSTAAHDRAGKVKQCLLDIMAQEYFIHQPEGDKPPEFRGWRRNPSDTIEEISPDAQGGLFSQTLNLWLRWEDQPDKVRLLRPYLPDGTPIATPKEMKRELDDLKALAQEEAQRRQQLEAELEQLRAELAALRSKRSE